MSALDKPSRHRERLQFFGVLAAAAVLMFSQLGQASVVSEEFRWAEIAREMYLQGVDLPVQIAFEEPSHPWERDDQIGDKLVLLKLSYTAKSSHFNLRSPE